MVAKSYCWVSYGLGHPPHACGLSRWLGCAAVKLGIPWLRPPLSRFSIVPVASHNGRETGHPMVFAPLPHFWTVPKAWLRGCETGILWFCPPLSRASPVPVAWNSGRDTGHSMAFAAPLTFSVSRWLGCAAVKLGILWVGPPFSRFSPVPVAWHSGRETGNPLVLATSLTLFACPGGRKLSDTTAGKMPKRICE